MLHIVFVLKVVYYCKVFWKNLAEIIHQILGRLIVNQNFKGGAILFDEYMVYTILSQIILVRFVNFIVSPH